jgi:transcriptional regulator with XRE-family HTH domain
MDDADDSIGRRIKEARKWAGLTQTRLAHELGISPSLLEKIEKGEREAKQPVVAGAARVLGIDITDLTHQPYFRKGAQPDRVHQAMPVLRRALAYWDFPPELDGPSRPQAEVISDAFRLSKLRQLDRNVEVVEQLPAVMLQAVAHYHEDGTEQEKAALVDAITAMLHAAHSVAYKLGYEDFSVVIENRIQWLSTQVEDPMLSAFSDWVRTNSLMRMGDYGTGLRILERARVRIDPMGREDPEALRMLGSLHLRSGIIAARHNRPDEARAHVVEAQRIAVHQPTDTDGDWRSLGFGETNVGIHSVATAVESGDGPTALALNDQVHLPAEWQAKLPTRVGHHYLDLSRAQFWQGHHEDSLASLDKARQVAPQQTRHHPTAHEVTRLLVRAHRATNQPLVDFTTWLGGDGAGQ